MKTWIIGIIFLGFASSGFSQLALNESDGAVPALDIESSANMNYYRQVTAGSLASVVEGLQYQAATYDVTHSAEFIGSKKPAQVTFKHDKGYIIAQYGRDGRLESSQERYKNVALSVPARLAIARDFPGWTMTSNTYRVWYEKGSKPTKMYKIVLEKDGRVIRVKLDCQGNEI